MRTVIYVSSAAFCGYALFFTPWPSVDDLFNPYERYQGPAVLSSHQ